MIRQNRTYQPAARRGPAASAQFAPPQTEPASLRGKAPALAMAYLPGQEYEDLYTPSEALAAGTLFRQLDMPFHGCFRI